MQSTLRSVIRMLPSSVCIDNSVFRLHYKATTALLLVCCLLVTSKQCIEDPIECFVDGDYGKNKARNTYCWNHLTFGPSHTVAGQIGEQIRQPGVATPEDGDELKYPNFYQVVGFMLFFQAMLFSFPHYLWKKWEGGKCKMMVTPEKPEETQFEQLKRIIDYFTQLMNTQNFYAARFFCCEVLNFFNVVAQIFFMYFALGYEFSLYGPRALAFPKEANCTFEGNPGRCLLPINNFNEKIYAVPWYWFNVLAMVTGLALLYRLAVLLSPQMRLQWPVMPYGNASPRDVRLVAEKCRIGDWFFLCQIGNNMNPIAFKELIVMLKQRLSV